MVAGTVGVAAIYSVGLHHMSRYVKVFEERHPAGQRPPGVPASQPRGGAGDRRRGRAGLALLSQEVARPERDSPGARRRWCWRSIRRIASRAGPSVPVSELDGEPFIAFDPELPIRRAIDRFLRQHDGPGRTSSSNSTTSRTSSDAVEIPSGVSILPEPSLAHEVKAGTLVAVPIEGHGPGRPADPPAGDHPPAARLPRSGGGEVPGAC